MNVFSSLLRLAGILPALIWGSLALAQPSAPTNVTATDVGATTIALSWTASTGSPTAYEVYANGVSKGTVSGTSASISGLAELTIYSFTVFARNSAGDWSPSSAPKIIKTWKRLVAGSGTITGQWEWNEEEERDTWNGSTDSYVITAPSSGSVRIWTTGTTNTIGMLLRSSPTFFAESGSGGQGGNMLLNASVTAGTYYLNMWGEGDGVTGSYEVFTDFKPNVVLDPSFSASPSSGRAPLAVTFDASGSTATNGQVVNYAWDFTNSGTTTATGTVATTVYQNTGSIAVTQTAKLTIADLDGATAQTTRVITIYPAGSFAVGVQDGTTTLPYAMPGASVTLQASPPVAGLQFNNWTIVSGSGTFGSANSATTTFTVGSADTFVRANYVPDVTLPTTPTSVAAPDIGATSVALAWNGSTDNVGVTGYEIFANGVSKGIVSGTSATVTGLSELTVYQFTIRAQDAAGNLSTPSSPKSIRTWQRLVAASGTITGQWEWNEEEQRDTWSSSLDAYPISVPTVGTARIFTTGSTNTWGAIYRPPPYSWAESGSGGQGANVLLSVTVPAGASNIYISGEGDSVTGAYQVFVDYKPAVTANFAATPLFGRAPLTVNFDATNSTDPEWAAMSFAWDFDNNGSTDATTLTPSTTYTNSGISAVTYTAKLTVTNSSSGTASSTKAIAVYPQDSRAVSVQGGTTSLPFQMTGSTVTLTATQTSALNDFTGWTLVSGAGTFANATSSTTTFTLGASDCVIRANYALNSQVASSSFSSPGSYSYTVPNGAAFVLVKAWGAGGGYSYSNGGAGAFGSAIIPVSSGQSIGIAVGAGGSGGYASSQSSSSYNGGTGGASVITINSGAQLSAGGGSGGGASSTVSSPGAPGIATVSGSGWTGAVLLTGTGALPPNTTDSAYPGGNVAYGSSTIAYGYGDSSGWYQFGAPGQRGHVVLLACALDTQAPSKPVGLRVSNVTAGSFVLNWDAATDNFGISGYEVMCNGTSLGLTSALSKTISVPMAGQTYVVIVRAVDAFGNQSTWSDPFNCKPYSITIEGASQQSASQYPGTTVSLSAVVPSGKYFTGWSVTGGGSVVSPQTPTSSFVVGPSDAVVRALFAPGYQLTTNQGAQLSSYGGQSGSSITISAAAPATGYIFVGWSIASGPGMIVDSRQLTTLLIMGAGNTSVYPVYVATTQARPPEAVVGGGFAVDPTETFLQTAVGTCWGSTFTSLRVDYSIDGGVTWNSGSAGNGRLWTGTSSWVSYPSVSQQIFQFTMNASLLPPGNVYFRVTASGASGSSPCGYGSVFVRGSPTLSAIPSGLAASNMAISTDSYGNAQRSFTLSWAPPQSTTGVAYYDVLWNGMPWTSVPVTQTSSNGATWDPAAGEAAQVFRVRCRDNAQNVGEWSTALSVWLPSLPRVLTQPVSQTLSVGQSLSLSIVAGGSAPLTYQWKKDGTPINQATSSTYSISSVQLDDAGSYRCVVSNPYGTAESNAAVVVVNNNNYAPTFTTQPISQTVAPGANVTFSAATSAMPAATYQWRKNGAPISGEVGTTLVLTNVQTSATGGYDVVATNSVGSQASGVATLIVSSGDPTADDDGDGVANGVELALGLNPNDPTDVNVQRFEYDRLNQLKRGPGGEYVKDVEGNIMGVRP